MKKFEYIGINNEKPIIFINSLDDISFLYSEIFDYFSIDYGESFDVIVDLFLRNGFSFNRFVKINFCDKFNMKLELVNPGDIDEEIKIIIRNYLKKNIDLLEIATIEKSIKDYILNK